MPRKNLMPGLIILTLLIAGVSLASCGGGNNSSVGPAIAQSSPTIPKVGFEADLEYVRKGQYTYVWVFARKDGKPLDKDDGAYLRANAHQVVDWVTTDGGKRVIAGTNFDLALGNLALLQKRFVVEDYTSR
jgi:hypothetical protein